MGTARCSILFHLVDSGAFVSFLEAALVNLGKGTGEWFLIALVFCLLASGAFATFLEENSFL